jgi:hypothetical protein
MWYWRKCTLYHCFLSPVEDIRFIKRKMVRKPLFETYNKHNLIGFRRFKLGVILVSSYPDCNIFLSLPYSYGVRRREERGDNRLR